MLTNSLRILRRWMGTIWHLRGHPVAILRHALRERRRGVRRVVFIDLGAADGDTATQALSEFPSLDRLILFEPGRQRFEKLSQHFAGNARIECIQAAAGPLAVESARLYHEQRIEGRPYFDGQGDSLQPGKRNIDQNDFEEVRIMAIPLFLLEQTQPDDRIFLKMDIEGGEYDLLEAMIGNGSIGRVSRLFCEWHGSKLGIPSERHRKLVDDLQRHGLAVTGLNRYDEFRLRRREHS